YTHFKSYDKAKVLLESVLANLTKEDKEAAFTVQLDIANIYLKKEKYREAEILLLKLVNTHPVIKYQYQQYHINYLLAYTYRSLGKVGESIKYADQCSPLYEAEYNSAYLYIAECKRILAANYFSLGNIEKSLKLLKESKAIALKNGYESIINNNLVLSALIFAAKGQHQDAINSQMSFVNKIENGHVKAYQDVLNETLNLQQQKYETKESKKKIQGLKENKRLLQLELAQQNRLYSSVAILIVFLFITAFFIYKRNEERESKLSLEKEVDLRTLELKQARDKLLKLSLLDG
ncbi:MAG: tetratricopeptide repeat protein, partial [Candidatus Scalindua sp.]|nr:tetratricopeptide repeat protein [Candidatus Scalindua sp.]